MSVAILRFSPPRPGRAADATDRHQRAVGRLAISFAKSGENTHLAEVYQRSPCRVLFPRPLEGEPPLAVLVNTSGGLAGGDRVSIAVKLGSEAAATITTQAAEKVYRSLGPDSAVETQLKLSEGARLEWLPQESILFDGACLDRRISAKLAPDSRLLACESLVFGRVARGETMTHGRVREFWHIERGGRAAWVDRFGLSGGIGARLDGPGFRGARALATALYVGPDAPAMLPLARQVAEAEGGGASLINGVLVARLLDANPARLRDGLARLLGALRRAAFGSPAGVPPLWAI
jgi:urease accessory protein